MLELYNDPNLACAFPVPNLPGFPSDSCYLTIASAAHMSGICHTISRIPHSGFSPVSHRTGFTALLQLPCPCRPTSPIVINTDWVEGNISVSSARRSAASPYYGHSASGVVHFVLSLAGFRRTISWRLPPISLSTKNLSFWHKWNPDNSHKDLSGLVGVDVPYRRVWMFQPKLKG